MKRKANSGPRNVEALDEEILRALQRDPRASFRDVARKLGIAVGTAQARTKRLQDDKIIRHFSLDLDYSKLGFTLTALILLQVKGKHLREVETRLAHIRNVCVVYDVTGDFDVAIVAKFPSSAAMDQFIKEVLSMDYVQRTVTSIVLNNVKEDYNIIL